MREITFDLATFDALLVANNDAPDPQVYGSVSVTLSIDQVTPSGPRPRTLRFKLQTSDFQCWSNQFLDTNR